MYLSRLLGVAYSIYLPKVRAPLDETQCHRQKLCQRLLTHLQSPRRIRLHAVWLTNKRPRISWRITQHEVTVWRLKVRRQLRNHAQHCTGSLVKTSYCFSSIVFSTYGCCLAGAVRTISNTEICPILGWGFHDEMHSQSASRLTECSEFHRGYMSKRWNIALRVAIIDADAFLFNVKDRAAVITWTVKGITMPFCVYIHYVLYVLSRMAHLELLALRTLQGKYSPSS